MKKININAVPITTAILFIICIVVSGALAFTNFVTKDRIKTLEDDLAKQSVASVLPADEHIEQTIEINGAVYSYHKAIKEGKAVGYVTTGQTNGYGGIIKVMVGADTNGVITDIVILSASDETPGLGYNITKSSFYEQYKGKKTGVQTVKTTPAEGSNEVKAVTSATISSTAVSKAVNNALDVINQVIEKEKLQTVEGVNNNVQE